MEETVLYLYTKDDDNISRLSMRTFIWGMTSKAPFPQKNKGKFGFLRYGFLAISMLSVQYMHYTIEGKKCLYNNILNQWKLVSTSVLTVMVMLFR